MPACAGMTKLLLAVQTWRPPNVAPPPQSSCQRRLASPGPSPLAQRLRSSYRSRHVGFMRSISLTFQPRFQALIRFSRTMASSIVACTSYHTRSFRPYRRVKPATAPGAMLPDAPRKIGRDARVQRPVALVADDVNGGLHRLAGPSQGMPACAGMTNLARLAQVGKTGDAPFQAEGAGRGPPLRARGAWRWRNAVALLRPAQGHDRPGSMASPTSTPTAWCSLWG
jgi:hypothetical protein